MTLEELEEYEVLLKLQIAADNMLPFVQATMSEYRANFHHEVIARRLQDLLYQENQRIMISLPPRHGKSELVSVRYPAWRLGNEPNRRIIITSYGASLANKFNRHAQACMSSPSYREIFPDTRIPGVTPGDKNVGGRTYIRNTKECEVIGYNGSLYSVGSEGAITGMGADDLLIDDPHKDQHEANSLLRRDRVWEWYIGTISTRLERGANVIVCQTRWHKDDLTGRLLAEAEFGGEFAEGWEQLIFPALATGELDHRDPRVEGEALWPWKYDRNRLLKVKSKSNFIFSAQFQQTPVIDGGNIIKEDWLKTYDVLPVDGEWAQTWDFSFGSKSKTASFVVGQVWLRSGPNYFLVDQIRAKLEFTEMQDAITRMIDKYPQCHKILVEKKAAGGPILNTLRSKFNRLYPINPQGDKEQRLHACSPLFECGNVWLPRHAGWRKGYVEELTTFPAAADDDQVDATSQMLNYWWEGDSSAIILPTSIERKTPWR